MQSDPQNTSEPSNRYRLRHSRLNIIPNPPRWQKEQRNQSTTPNLRIMMGPRPRTRPASTLPPLHTLQLSTLINLHHTINFPIGMNVILPRILFLRIHIHGRDAEVMRC